jgi:hypothetical protein
VLLALLAMLVLAPSSHALHGGEHQKPPRDRRPGNPPPAPPLDSETSPSPAQPATAASNGAVPTTGVLGLRQLVAESPSSPKAVVARTDSLDEDRLRVYHLTVERAIKGDAGGPEVAIIEMRGSTSRPGSSPTGITHSCCSGRRRLSRISRNICRRCPSRADGRGATA